MTPCLWVQLAPATGGFALGQLVGSLYEREAHNQSAGKSCYGVHCFRWVPPLCCTLTAAGVHEPQFVFCFLYDTDLLGSGRLCSAGLISAFYALDNDNVQTLDDDNLQTQADVRVCMSC